MGDYFDVIQKEYNLKKNETLSIEIVNKVYAKPDASLLVGATYHFPITCTNTNVTFSSTLFNGGVNDVTLKLGYYGLFEYYSLIVNVEQDIIEPPIVKPPIVEPPIVEPKPDPIPPPGEVPPITPPITPPEVQPPIEVPEKSLVALFEKDGTYLNELENVLECIVTEERNGLFECSLLIALKEENYGQLQEDRIIVCNASGRLKKQMFRIDNIKELHNNTIQVLAKHITYDLEGDTTRLTNCTGDLKYMLSKLFSNSYDNTKYNATCVAATETRTRTMDTRGLLDAIIGDDGLLDLYQDDDRLEVVRDNKSIVITNDRGLDNGATIEYGVNLIDIKVSRDTSDLITVLRGYVNPEGRYIAGGTSWETYETVISINAKNFGYNRRKTIDCTNNFPKDAIITKEKIKHVLNNYFERTKCDKVKKSITLDFIPLYNCIGYEHLQNNDIGMSDIVRVKDKRYNIDEKLRVVKYTYNVLKERVEKIELGEIRTSLAELIIPSDTFWNLGQDDKDQYVTNGTLESTEEELKKGIADIEASTDVKIETAINSIKEPIHYNGEIWLNAPWYGQKITINLPNEFKNRNFSVTCQLIEVDAGGYFVLKKILTRVTGKDTVKGTIELQVGCHAIESTVGWNNKDISFRIGYMVVGY